MEFPALLPSPKKKKSRQWEAVKEKLQVGVDFVLKYAFSLILVTLTSCFWIFFHRYYYRHNEHFVVEPKDIVIRGNSVFSRDFLLSVFEINEPRNGFNIVLSNLVERLRREMPLIKDVQMTYEPGKQLEIWVVERTPIARLARPTAPGVAWASLVVDEEGVIFAYPRPQDAYPEIGDQEYAKLVEPGDRLPSDMHCMLHLIRAATDLSSKFSAKDRPSSIKRISQLSNDTEDGLLVSLVDGRQIKIAWPGMSTERNFSEDMVGRLQKVALLLRDPLLVGQKHFNAMAPDRIAVSE